MLKEIFGLYLQGLLLATVTLVLIQILWLGFRAYRKLDKTKVERQQQLYDALLICLMTIPIVAFAFMAILLMLKA